MLLQKINTIILIFISIGCIAQTEIDNRIILNGVNPNDKQVLNIGAPIDSNSVVRPEDIKYGKYNFATVTSIGQDTLQLSFQQPVEKLKNGDLFFFINPTANNKPVILSVQNMDTLIPLMINNKDSVGRGRLIANQTIGAIYYKNHAYIISKTEKTCPTGYIKVNNNYCIEQNERTAKNFYNAVSDCIDENAELCNFGEWYFACYNRVALGLTGMTNNYEWLDDASNDVLQVRIIGSSSCTSVGNSTANVGNLNYRCCYIIK